ncbi:MAG: penicillin acylase family protein [Thermodesulfobacteriota bacterium]
MKPCPPKKTIVILYLAILLAGLLAGCTSVLDVLFDDSLLPEEGTLKVKGLSGKVTVRRNDLGIPVITADNMDDLVFAQGFVSAGDRLTQMAGFRLAAQGRLSEMAGEAMFETDLFLRSLDINRAARIIYDAASDDLRHLLQVYSDGVNAYLDLYHDRLPRALTMGGYRPEKWQPVDCASVFVLITLGLAQNLHEEIDILNMARIVGPEKTAWLTPIYPDEPIPLAEFKKLESVDFSASAAELQKLFAVSDRLKKAGLSPLAASNNWVVSGQRTESGKSLLANDTHLPLSMPSIWYIMQLSCPQMQGAGVCLAGTPGIVAGYNGHVAWGMTMVMADNQDIFIEKLKKENDGLYYLYKDQWQKTTTRTETFNINGADPVTRTIHETRHGALVNGILTDRPRNDLVTQPVTDLPFGIAVAWAAFEADRSMDAFFSMMKATTAEEAMDYARQIRAIPLNMVIADENNIAWQVTGRYPVRKEGRGLCPSPGWTGTYDWQGYIDPADHPSVFNPGSGFVGTANHRIIPADSPQVLSSSWYYPDRAARIHQMIEEAGKYTFDTAKKMHRDVQSPFTSFIREILLMDQTIQSALSGWSQEKRDRAGKAQQVLEKFDGELTVDSPGAAVCGAFLHCLAKNLFADELGGTDTVAWRSLLDTFLVDYSALQDHFFPRARRSPFWDNVNTPEKETRAAILAETLYDTVDLLETNCGTDPAEWRWGDLHTYNWKTEGTKMADHMKWLDRTALKLLAPYFDRGPYPAPGDHNTLNVAGYHPGNDFDVWLIPAMRVIVDFGQEEPLYAVNSSGQSDNPASPHYDDGIAAWRQGEYMHLPFDKSAVEKACPKKLELVPE